MKLFRPPGIIDWLSPSVTWRFAVSGPVVFLTFDDGPHPDITPFVLDQLAIYNFKATFFCVGENLKRYPDIAKRIIAEGHIIANHTMRHTKGTSVTNSEYFNSVADFEQVYRSALFRPPYGRIRKSQIRAIKKTHRIILWSFLTYDYHKDVSVSKILRKAKRMKKGDIVVLHDNPKILLRQQELLPALLQLMQKKHLRSAAIPS